MFAALAFAVGVIPWLPTVTFSFAYDDAWTIVGNEALRRPLGVLWRAALSGVGAREIPDVSRPLMVTSNWLDLALFGLSPAGHHATSIVWHGLAVTAAAFAARALLHRADLALTAAALFSVAPGHAEAVAAVNYREDLLATAGVFTALTTVAWPRRHRAPLPLELAAALAFLLALLSKESALALAPMVAGLALAQPAPWRWLAKRERLLTLLAATALVWSQWRFALSLAGDGVPRAPSGTSLEVLARLGRYLCWSLATGLGAPGTAPVHEAYGEPHPALALVLVGLVALAAALRWRRRRRALAAMALWLGGALGSSPLVGPTNEIADRYLVLGSLGLAVAVVVTLRGLRARTRAGAAALTLAVAAVWGLGAFRDAHPWHSDDALWAEATSRAPGAAKAWVGLAWARRRAGAFDEARAALETALSRAPDHAPAYVSLAYVGLLADDLVGARRALARVDALGAQATPGYQRARRCLELDRDARHACARGEPFLPTAEPR